LHHVSTDEVFGSLDKNDEPFNEETPYAPRSPYSASKAAADHLVRAYFHTHNVAVTISNCSNNYGPYHFPEKLIPLAITNILEGEKVPVYGEGLQVRDWLYVADHCRAIDLILHKGKLGETYCIGGAGNEYTNIEVINVLIALMGKGAVEFVKDRPGHDNRYAIDAAKIKRELGWQPQVTLEEGLKKTVAWFEANREWWQKIKSGAYREYYEKQYGDK
jgi:dTDP-glucose 4,6-dehydratase